MTASQYGNIDRRALRDHAHERVLEMLLNGQVKAGQRLPIEGLAERLSMSPTPVREALVDLERTGLVAREARKGYRVAPLPDTKQLAELIEARMMLELVAARGASRTPKETLPDLKLAHGRHVMAARRVLECYSLESSVPVKLTRDYFIADAHFHQAIFAHAGNRYVEKMYEQLGALTHLMRQTTLRGTVDVSDAVAEHSAILKAFEAGDPETIVSAVHAHIEGVRWRSLPDTRDQDL